MSRFKSLENQKFNKLTVINLNKINSSRAALWNCLCDCGNLTVVSTNFLKRGRIKSCGCLRNQSKVINLKNKRFGNYIAIERAFLQDKKGNKSSGWKCQCDCGHIQIIETNKLTSGHSRGCKKCMKNKIMGIKHPRWNPHLTKQDRITRRNLPELVQWRKDIYKRDNFTCQVTGKTGGNLCAHHLESWHSNRELRFELTNGITVLKSVHKLFHKLYGMKNNTKQQFEEFKNNLTKKEIQSFK